MVDKVFQDVPCVVKRLDEISSKYCNDELFKESVHNEARQFFWPLLRYIQQFASPTVKTELAITMTEEIFQKLTDGILRRYINELKMTNKVESQDFLMVVLALETLFMELSNEVHIPELLVRVGALYLLVQQLKLLYRMITVNREMKKFIIAPALAVSNCTQTCADLYMFRHGGTNTSDLLSVLKPYLLSSDPLIASCAKFIRNNFSWYLYRTHPDAVICPSHIEELIQFLFASFSPSPLTATAILMEPTDVLIMLRSLCVSNENRITLLEHSKFPVAMSHLLDSKPQKEPEVVISTLNLILSLLSPLTIPLLAKVKTAKNKPANKEHSNSTDFIPLLKKLLPHLDAWLANLDCGHSSELKELRDTVLFALGANTIFSTTRSSMLNQCYKHKHYELLISQATNENSPLVEMKARYQLYCRNQIILQQKEKDIIFHELANARRLLYDEARKIVPYFVKSEDEEAKKILDHVLMDLVRDLNERSGLNKSNAHFNCILCHKFDAIVKGHFWAKSHFLAIRGKDKKYIKDRASMHKEPKRKEVSQIVYYMFCTNCDNCLLSVDEQYFSDTFVCVIYPSPDSTLPTLEHSIEYKGASLYRFCLGLAFRTLALQKGTFSYVNSTAVYDLIKNIRKALLSGDETSADAPIALLFFTPSKAASSIDKTSPTVFNVRDEETSDLRFIDGSDFSRVSYLPIYSSATPNKEKAQFIHIKEGIFNFVVLIERAKLQPEHEPFIINPTGGMLHIPPNDQRMITLFPAMIQTYKERVPIQIKDILEEDPKVSSLLSLQYITSLFPDETTGFAIIPRATNIVTPSCVNPSSVTPNDTCTSTNSTCTASAGATPSSTTATVSTVSMHLEAIPYPMKTDNTVIEHNFNLLPIKHSIDRNVNHLNLPPDHKVLLHHTQYGVTIQSGQTVILAIDSSNDPYAIIHKFSSNALLSLGYFVSPNDFSFTNRLNKKQKHKAMELLIQEHHYLLNLPSQLLPIALLAAGLTDFNSLMTFHKSGFSIDRKCIPGFGCWYCSLLCEVCQAPQKFGSFVKTLNGTNYKFCSQSCLNLYGNITFDEDPLAENTDSDSPKLGSEKDTGDMPLRESPQDSPSFKEIPQDSPHHEEVPQDSLPLEEVPQDSQPLEEVPQDPMPLEKVPQDSLPLEKVPQDSISHTEVSQDSVHFDVNSMHSINLDVIVCHEEYPSLNNSVLLMTISSVYHLVDDYRVSVKIKLFHTSSELPCNNSAKYLPLIPMGSDSYFIVCQLQLVFEQYLGIYSISVDGEISEAVYNNCDDSDSLLSSSQRNQILNIALHDGILKSNVASLALLF